MWGVLVYQTQGEAAGSNVQNHGDEDIIAAATKPQF